MNKDLYISLITKKLSSELNTAELKDLNSWLNNSKDNAIVLQDFKNVWQATSGYKSGHTFDADSAFQSFANRFDIPLSKEVQINAPSSSFLKLLVSGVLLTLTALVAYFLISNLTGKDIVANDNMHAMTISLNEYSDVTLSPESAFKKNDIKNIAALEVDSDINKPNLIDFKSPAALNALKKESNYLLTDFNGQGYFDIKNIHHNTPYVITLNNGSKVVAFDASYNVQNYDDESETILDVQSGVVLFQNNDKIHQVGEGERLILNEKNGAINKVRTPELSPFTWHKGILTFNKTPLIEVFNIIERFYGVDIEVMDDSPVEGHYTVSNLKPGSLNECLELLHNSVKMDIKRKGLRKIEIRNIQAN